MNTHEYMNKQFSIGSIRRVDILDLFAGNMKDEEKFKKDVEELSDRTMQGIAWDVGECSYDDYFWDELKIAVEENINVKYKDEEV